LAWGVLKGIQIGSPLRIAAMLALLQHRENAWSTAITMASRTPPSPSLTATTSVSSGRPK
jgi:hypothetical protein